MKDYLFWVNLLMLVLNVATFIYLMSVKNVYMRTARVILIGAIFIGTIANFGKLTVWNVLFALTPFITLTHKHKPNGKVFRFIERIRGNRWRHNEPVQRVQGHSQRLHKTVARQKT